jgi:hypothetical protein
MRRLAGFLSLALASSVVAGHHANIEHDTNIVEELEGQITTISWRNPHVRMHLSILAEDGADKIWGFEAQDVNSLGRRGLHSELVPVGAMVRVAGHPSRSRNSLLCNLHGGCLGGNRVDGATLVIEASNAGRYSGWDRVTMSSCDVLK